ncbi:MAG: hypothetical protein MUF80_05065 [Burkholderiales bacterium]|nr:hypothetical protein [Burkholderiales bacterium]
MTRPLRVEYRGAHYHVTAAGDRREAIFDGDCAGVNRRLRMPRLVGKNVKPGQACAFCARRRTLR